MISNLTSTTIVIHTRHNGNLEPGFDNRLLFIVHDSTFVHANVPFLSMPISQSLGKINNKDKISRAHGCTCIHKPVRPVLCSHIGGAFHLTKLVNSTISDSKCSRKTRIYIVSSHLQKPILSSANGESKSS